MAQIMVDTNELKQNAQNIINLQKNVTDELNMLFKRIEEVPSITKEWVGSSSVKFSELSKDDKLKYYKFIEDLNLYSRFLSDFATSLDTCINNIKGRA